MNNFSLIFVKGWLTIGPGLTNSNFNLETYLNYFEGNSSNNHLTSGYLTGCTERIEALRPKSPPRNQINHNAHNVTQIRQPNNLRNSTSAINKSRINNRQSSNNLRQIQ